MSSLLVLSFSIQAKQTALTLLQQTTALPDNDLIQVQTRMFQNFSHMFPNMQRPMNKSQN